MTGQSVATFERVPEGPRGFEETHAPSTIRMHEKPAGPKPTAAARITTAPA